MSDSRLFTFSALSSCTLCPRRCGVNREAGERGVCRAGKQVRLALASLHRWEEPPISGTNGSGALFFSGCSLRCVFCQNRDISQGSIEKDLPGKELSVEELAETMLRLEKAGAHNLNLVTGTHFLPQILEALRLTKGKRQIPVVWNSGGYETEETVDALSEFVDIWLPDFKYVSPALSKAYSGAPDYATVAKKAIVRMYRHAGKVTFGADGLLKRGLIVRHLVLPGCRHDSFDVLETLAKVLPPEDIRLSLMWQYTPDFLPSDCQYRNLQRRVTRFEYESVRERACLLGFDGYGQGKDAASRSFTPDFL